MADSDLSRTTALLGTWAHGARGVDLLVALAADLWAPVPELLGDDEPPELEAPDQWAGKRDALGNLGSLACLADARVHLHAELRGGELGPVCDLLWLDIDKPSGRVYLPDATLTQARRDWIVRHGAKDGRRPDLEQHLMLLVSVHGDDYALPDLVLVGPRRIEQRDGRTHYGDRVLKLTLGREMADHGMNAVRSRLAVLGQLADPERWRNLFQGDDAGDLRTKVRKAMKDRLAEAMRLLERHAGREAEASELPILREAATLLAFRLMFLREVERRRLLYRTDAPPSAALGELGVQVIDDQSRAVPGELLSRFRSLCASMRGEPGSSPLAIAGASIFATTPNDAFDRRLRDWLGPFDAADAAFAPGDLVAWDRLVAELGNVVLGFLDDHADTMAGRSKGVAHGTLGIGGTEHTHRILGDVYEQVLALVPKRGASGAIELVARSADGKKEAKDDRKALGAHYTPERLVQEMVRPALGALFRHAWPADGDIVRYQARLRALRVVDPAMGSGHFLTVAAAEIARELAFADLYGRHRAFERHEAVTFKDPESEVAEGDRQQFAWKVQTLLPGVVRTACYGVDVNPLACELGKLALWLFTLAVQESVPDAEKSRPELTFLDGNLRCGNSLVGMDWDEAGTVIEERLGVSRSRVRMGGEAVDDRYDRLLALQDHLRLPTEELFIWAHDPAGMTALGAAPLPVDQYAARKRLLDCALELAEPMRWYFDLAVLAALTGATPRKNGDRDLRHAIAAVEPSLAAKTWSWESLVTMPMEEEHSVLGAVRRAIPRALSAQGHTGVPLRPLHWHLEFPAVLTSKPGVRSGFDAVLANPPFTGDRNLRGVLGQELVGYLCDRLTAHRAGGTPDLAGFFVLRYDQLVASRGGVAATLAPNTLAQAKNRKTVLVPLVNTEERFRIFRAVQSFVWPGEAAVHVCMVHLGRPDVTVKPALVSPTDTDWVVNERWASTFLDPYLDAPLLQRDPVTRDFRDLPSSHTDLCFQGMVLRGADGTSGDFVKPISFLNQVPDAERSAVKAYFENIVIQNRPTPAPFEVSVDFFGVLEDGGLIAQPSEAQIRWLKERFPFCLAAIDDVRCTRLALKDSTSNRNDRVYWWLYNSPRPKLRAAWRGLPNIVLIGRVGKIWAPSVMIVPDPTTGLGVCPTDKLIAVPLALGAGVAVLSVFAFELHVRRTSSSLKSDLNFTPENSLPSFPFPWPSRWSTDLGHPTMLPPPADADAALTPVVTRLLDTREDLLLHPEATLGLTKLPKDWGPTELYNRYDDSGFRHSGIDRLRTAHRDLLDAVLRLYGWADLAGDMARDAGAGWTFDHPWLDRSERYVPRLEWREAMLGRLVALNETRYWEEIDLYLPHVERAVGSQAAMASALAKQLKDAKVRLSDEDLLCALIEGKRQKRFVCSNEKSPADPTNRWRRRG